MKKHYILGFLLLLVSTIGIMSSSVYANEPIDSDGDGVPNDVDFCPFLLEDYESTVDGCPSSFVPWYDADSDGIQDHLDNCPTVKENYNKFQDDDGCPDLSPAYGKGTADTDDDGYIDYLDLCPNQPETYNGIDDDDGWPASFGSGDLDRDGIPDDVDACPLEPETYNKFQDIGPIYHQFYHHQHLGSYKVIQ